MKKGFLLCALEQEMGFLVIYTVEQGLYQNGFEKSAVKVGVTLFGVCEYAPVTS